MRLPMYKGALRRRLEIEQKEEQKSQDSTQDYSLSEEEYARYYNDDDTEAPRSMTMREALAKSKGSQQGVLDAMNEESSRSSFGPLFERTVVKKND